MICIWKRERERDRRRDKEAGRCLILPALFSGVTLRRLRVCQRSRRAWRCTDSRLHAGSLLFTEKKKAALFSHWLLVVARLWHRGAFTGQRVDTDGDYIYQLFSSGVNWHAGVGGAQSFRCLIFLFSVR